MTEVEKENAHIFGRKIFFVCSTFTLNTNIILRLMQQEYEVYKIDEPRLLKNLLKLDPNAIVCINADSHFVPAVWYNFISSFEHDPEFESCDFAVFSAKLKGSAKLRFEQGLKLKAGFFSLDKNFGEIMSGVIEKLENLKAKGLRKFVRLNCTGDKSAEAYFINGNMMYKMNFVDISSIGVGLIIPSKYASAVRVNSVIQGLTLVLGNKQLKVNAKIHTIKAIQNGILAVLIFTPDTPDSFRNFVRTYICEELQKRLNNKMIHLSQDTTDYTVEVASPAENEDKKDSETDGNSEENKENTESTSQTASAENVEEAEAVEELAPEAEEAQPEQNS